jgi:fatty acid desaturase
MELACSLRAWLILAAPIAGLTTWSRLPLLYAIAVAILTLNHLRALSSHRFLGDGDRMSHSEQFFDSTIITGNLFTSLICPLGQRFHGLHHLIPSLPYHNLAEAHRRLSSELPANSAYHNAVYPSYFAVLREMRRHYLTHQSDADQIKRRWYETGPDRDTLQIKSRHEEPQNLSASA